MSENERQTGPINETEPGTPLRPAQAQKTAPVPLRRVLLLAGLLAAAALVLGLLALRDRIAPARRHGTFSYAAPEEENTFRFVEGKYNAYAALGDAFVTAAGDGLTVFDRSGTVLGAVQAALPTPLLVTGGRMALACDAGGNRLAAIDEDGAVLLDQETEGTLLDADVSVGGAVCYAELGQDGETLLTVLDRRQRQIYRYHSYTRYFSQCAVSEDAGLLCAAALGQAGGNFESTAVLFATDQEDPLCEVSLGSQLILDLRFLDGDTVCAVGEGSAVLFDRGGTLLGSYDYGGAALRDWSTGWDGGLLLALSPYGAGSRTELVALDRRAAVTARLTLEEELLSLSAAGDLCAVLTPSGLRIYDETLAQCASAGTLRAASAAVLLADGSVVLLDGGSGTRYLPE